MNTLFGFDASLVEGRVLQSVLLPGQEQVDLGADALRAETQSNDKCSEVRISYRFVASL